MSTPPSDGTRGPRRFLSAPFLVTAVSVALFLASLTQPAFDIHTPKGDQPYPSLLVLFIGWFGFWEYSFAWLANVLLVVVWRDRRSRPRLALAYALGAIALALTVLVQPLVVADDVAQYPVTHLDLGYYLWLASIFMAAISCLVPVAHPSLAAPVTFPKKI